MTWFVKAIFEIGGRSISFLGRVHTPFLVIVSFQLHLKNREQFYVLGWSTNKGLYVLWVLYHCNWSLCCAGCSTLIRRRELIGNLLSLSRTSRAYCCWTMLDLADLWLVTRCDTDSQEAWKCQGHFTILECRLLCTIRAWGNRLGSRLKNTTMFKTAPKAMIAKQCILRG